MPKISIDRSRRFNRACRLTALIYLLALVGVNDARRPDYADFAQFYMTGLVARAGAWEALYPTPMPGAVHNPGNWRDSMAKPRYDELAAEHGVSFTAFRFILPPPAALLFWPFAFFDGNTAHRIWLLLLTLAAWGTAVQAGVLFERCRKHRSRIAGILALLIAGLPLTYQSIRVSNLSPIVALMIGWAVIELARGDSPRGAMAIVLGAFSKYVTSAFLPLLLAMRRWRMLIATCLIGVTWALLALLIEGTGPYRAFLTSIAPTLSRSHEHIENVSISGVALRMLHMNPPLPPAWGRAILAVQLLTLVVILTFIFRRGRLLAVHAVEVCSASSALVLWIMLFSPVCWAHYLVYVCPLWGWLAWEARRSRSRAIGAGIVLLLLIVQLPAIDPLNVHLLMAMVMLMAMSLWRLSHPAAGAVQSL